MEVVSTRIEQWLQVGSSDSSTYQTSKIGIQANERADPVMVVSDSETGMTVDARQDRRTLERETTPPKTECRMIRL